MWIVKAFLTNLISMVLFLLIKCAIFMDIPVQNLMMMIVERNVPFSIKNLHKNQSNYAFCHHPERNNFDSGRKFPLFS